MKKQIFVEMAIADHFEITDRLDFPIEGFAWPSLKQGNVVSLASANPNKQVSFNDVCVSELPEKISYLSSCQVNPLTTMRFEVSFREDGGVYLLYTGFKLSPLEMLSNSGYSLTHAIKYYQAKMEDIVLYATCCGYYSVANQTNELGVF